MKSPQWIDLESAVNHIHHACEDLNGEGSPFFFLIGAGISHPPIPLASDIIEHCRVTAEKYGRINNPLKTQSMDKYSHWFQQAYPQPIQRQRYLRNLIEKKAISAANFRLAHLMLEKTITNIVITTNFDDFLSQALTLFGEKPIVCDHPNTVERIDTEQKDIQVIHVHGTHWFYDCCNLQGEIEGRSHASGDTSLTMPSLLDKILSRHSPLVVGYSGWENDVIMTALKRRLQNTLPYNLYWFCYRREDVNTLPDWLKYHQQVFFVAAPEKESKTQTVDELNVEGKNVEKPTKEAITEDLKSFSEKKEDESTLSAQKVFDKLIQKFELKAPELTRDPVGFYAKHLRRSLLLDNPEKGDSDIYSIESVIERIEQAKKIEEKKLKKSKQKEKGMNHHEIENLRNAIRRSQYHDAIELATAIDINELSQPQLHELMDTMWSVSTELYDDFDEELASYDLVIKIGDNLSREKNDDLILLVQIAKALVNKGITLGKLNRNEEAISVYEEVIKRFGESTETALQKQVANALFNKGARFGKLNRDEDVISAYEEVVKRFGDSKENAVQEQVASALFNKGVRFGKLNRNEEAISAYEEVVNRFDDLKETAIQKQVAMALVNKGVVFGKLNHNEDEISAYEEVVSRFGESKETAIQKQVAMALVNKGLRFGKLSYEETISAYEEVVSRFGESKETAIQKQVAKALYNKGLRFGKLNRNEEAISAYEEVVSRFGESTDTALKELVANAQLKIKNLKIANE